MRLQTLFASTAKVDRFWLWVKRILIIIGVIGFSAIAGLSAEFGMMPMALVLAAGAGLSGVLFAERFGRSEFGIIALVPVATLTNFVSLPTGTSSRIVLSLALALGLVGLWVFQIWFAKKNRIGLKPMPVNLPLILFVIVNMVSLVWSEVLRDPVLVGWENFRVVRIAALLVIVLLPLLTLFVANKVNEIGWIWWVVVLTLFSGAFIIISMLANLPLSMMFWNGSRGLFSVWVGAIALSLALFNEKQPLWLRGLLMLLAAAWFYDGFILNTPWLSAWAPLGVAGVVVILLRSRKLFFLVVIGLALAALLQQDWLQQNIIQANLDEGSGNRWSLWAMNLDLVFKHPLFGVGPAGYAPYYMTYHPYSAMSTHNNWFDVLAQSGFLGLGVFIWMMASVLRVGFKLKKALDGRRNFEEAFVNAVIAGLIAALVGMMLGDWVLPFAYNQTISGFDNAMFTWLFAGCLLGFYQIMKSRGELDAQVKEQV